MKKEIMEPLLKVKKLRKIKRTIISTQKFPKTIKTKIWKRK